MGAVAAFALLAQLFVYGAGLVAMLLLVEARGGRLPAIENLMTHAGFLLPVQAAWWGLVFWLVYRVVRARDPRPFRQAIGLVKPPWPPAAYIAGGILLALSVGALATLLPMPKQRSPMERLFLDATSALLIAGFGVLIAPLVEELLFRGFFFPVVARRHGSAAAVAATAGLFAVLHGPQYGWAWQNFLLLVYVGVVFGTVRARTGSVVPSTLIHAAYNLTLFAGFYVSTNRFRDF